MTTADALVSVLVSPNVADSNMEAANVVDVLNYISIAGHKIAWAITPRDAAGHTDAAGGHVTSLTEAVMGLTAAGMKIADALESIAAAIAESRTATP